MNNTDADVVTGAYSYTGKYIASALLGSGRTVRTITNHPDRRDPFEGRVEPTPYRFDDPAALSGSLEGATTLYNTYWVRFNRDSVTFDAAVENSQMLFEAARAAGVERIVHVSIANCSPDSSLPYYRGKALVEQALAASGVDHTIVRPTVVFGHEDVLINNIAWIIRHVHAFGIPGSGKYPIQPVHVEDLARCCVESAKARSGSVINAAGPETMTFKELVRMVRAATDARAVVFNLPPRLALLGSRIVGLRVRDVVLTREEVDGLMAGLLACEGEVCGGTSFREWLGAHGERIGAGYANELERHFRRRTVTAGGLKRL